MDPIVQVGGALLVLAGFVLSQLGILRTTSRAYLAANMLGASILALDAWIHGQWGFLLLEGVWALVSAAGLARSLRPRADRRSHAVIARSGPARRDIDVDGEVRAAL